MYFQGSSASANVHVHTTNKHLQSKTEMSDADATRRLWYYISGKHYVSSVFVSPNETVDDLKKKIYTMSPKSFIGCDAPDIILTKVGYIVMSINTNVMASAGPLHP